MTRCKFKVDNIMEYAQGYVYKLHPVFGEENRVYWESTPSGMLELNITKAKGKLFEVGKEYYLDISEVL